MKKGAYIQSKRFYLNDEYDTYSLTPGNTFTKKLFFCWLKLDTYLVNMFNNIPNSS